MDYVWSALNVAESSWSSILFGYLVFSFVRGLFVKGDNSQKQADPQANGAVSPPELKLVTDSASSQAASDDQKSTPVCPTHLSSRKSIWLAYVYYCLGGFATGTHHLYLGYHTWSVLHLCSLGFLFVGSALDAVLLPYYVWRVNRAAFCHPLAPRDSVFREFIKLFQWAAKAFFVLLIVIFIFPGIFEFVLDVDLTEGGNVLRKSPYKVLGVSQMASSREIKMTYRSLSKKYHPDLNPDCEDCADRMREVNDAWDKLKRRGGKSSKLHAENREGSEDPSDSEEGKDSNTTRSSAGSSGEGWDFDKKVDDWLNDFGENLEKKWETLINVAVRKADFDGWQEWWKNPKKKKKKAKASGGKKADEKSKKGKTDSNSKAEKGGREKTETETFEADEDTGPTITVDTLLRLDSDANGKLSLDEILYQINPAGGEQTDFVDSWKSMFTLADADVDGELNSEELAYLVELITRAGEETLDPVESTMRGFDSNKDGKLSLDELMQHAGADADGQFEGWKDGFKDADADKDGYLTAEELAHLLQQHSEEEQQATPQSQPVDPVESTLKGFDMNNDGKLSLDELLHHAGDNADGGPNGQFEGWKDGFHEADANKDGFLTAEELATLLRDVSKEVQQPTDHVKSTMQGFDIDKDGKLSLQELLQHAGTDAEGGPDGMFQGWQDGFREADSDKDGYLTEHELAKLLELFTQEEQQQAQTAQPHSGRPHVQAQAAQAAEPVEYLDAAESTMQGFDTDKDGRLSLQELLDNAGDDAAMFAGWETGFKEADADNDGYLTVKELGSLLNGGDKMEL